MSEEEERGWRGEEERQGALVPRSASADPCVTLVQHCQLSLQGSISLLLTMQVIRWHPPCRGAAGKPSVLTAVPLPDCRALGL